MNEFDYISNIFANSKNIQGYVSFMNSCVNENDRHHFRKMLLILIFNPFRPRVSTKFAAFAYQFKLSKIISFF